MVGFVKTLVKKLQFTLMLVFMSMKDIFWVEYSQMQLIVLEVVHEVL